MAGTFTVNDLRGEYWLYKDGPLTVNVGKGGGGGCTVNTSDMHVLSGGPIGVDKAADILIQLLEKMGAPSGGYNRLTLKSDGGYELQDSHFILAETRLGAIGFRRHSEGPGWVQWVNK